MNYKKTEYFESIAMKCTKDQFESIKPILEEFGTIGKLICAFEKYDYLTNDYLETKELYFDFINKHWCNSGKVIMQDKFNAETFLKACGIVSEPLYKLTAKEIVYGHDKPQYWKDTFKECFETELEVGKWYKMDCNESLFYITKLGKKYISAYGFNQFGEWVNEIDNFGLNQAYNKTPATEKEVEEALVKEAIKRGFKSGVVCNNSNIHKTKVNDSVLEYHYIKFKDNELRMHENDCKWYKIFSNGTWAEILLPTYTIPEAEKTFNIKIIKAV